MSVDVIIPTFQPKQRFLDLIERLEHQTMPVGRIIIKNTQIEEFEKRISIPAFLQAHPKVSLSHVPKAQFDHGATRQQGVEESQADYFICMTQDALPQDEFLVERLIAALTGRRDVAAAYARQLPEADCNPIERYTRAYNYPDRSGIRTAKDLPVLGIRTFYCSNVCAAYRRDVFDKLGGFVFPTVFNEDMIYAARAVKAGYAVAYAADAMVVHSHNYTVRQLFSRNFDLGVSHAQYPEIFVDVPPEGEGVRLVGRTARYLLQEHPLLLPKLFCQSAAKLTGYRLGKAYRRLPLFLVRRCSLQKEHWTADREIFDGDR